MIKPKKKSNWMCGFIITPPLTDLEKAQLETSQKLSNDFKKKIYRR